MAVARLLPFAVPLALVGIAAAAPEDGTHPVHPWARIPVGSWARYHDVTDSTYEGQKHHDESTRQVTLRAADDEKLLLLEQNDGDGESSVDENEVTIRDLAPWATVPREGAPEEVVTVDGREIRCKVLRFDHTEETHGVSLHLAGTAWCNDEWPHPLRLRSRLESDEETQTSEIQAEKLDVEIAVGDHKLHCVEFATRNLGDDGKPVEGSPTSRSWFSAEVPGLEVRNVIEGKQEDVEWHTETTLVDFFVAPRSEIARTEEQPAPAKEPDQLVGVALTARFVDAQGRPVADAKATLNGSSTDPTAEAKAGVAAKPEKLETKSDEDGRLALSFSPHPGFEFFFTVSAPGYAKMTWRFRNLRPGARLDLGEIRLQGGGTIVGSLLDPAGKPVPGGFYVMARLQGERNAGADREPTYEYGVPEKGRTDFRVENLPAGLYEVEPYLHAAGWVESAKQRVTVVEGQETRCDFVYEGPALDRRIRIITFVRPFHVLNPEPEHVKLTTAGGRELSGVDGGIQSIDFEDVTDGPCTLVIDDPRFETVRITGIQAGSRRDVALRGSCGLHVVATDQKTGNALSEVVVSQELHKLRSWPRRFPLHLAGAGIPADGVIRGAIPGDSKLYVSAPGYAEKQLDLKALPSGEVREIAVALDRADDVADSGKTPGSISGVLRDKKSHEPVAGVRVEATSSAEGDYDAKETTTGAQGSFRFDGLAPGRWNLQAKVSETIESPEWRLQLGPGQKRADIVLEVARGVELSGRIIGVADYPEGVGLVFAQRDGPFAGNDERFGWLREQQAELDQDGSYVVKDLAPGHYRVGLSAERPDLSIGPSHQMSGSTQHFVLAEIDVTSEPTQHQDFDARSLRPGNIVVRVHSASALPQFTFAVARSAEPEPQAGREGSSFDFDDSQDDDRPERSREFLQMREDGALLDDLHEQGSAMNLDSKGNATLTLLPAGSWMVGIRGRGGAWSVESDRPVALTAGETGECVLDVELVRASVVLADATSGAPLANENVRWLHSSSRRRLGMAARTDSSGRLELSLPRGKVRVWDVGTAQGSKDDPALALELDWPPTEETASLRRRR
jgi:hypothetical protein